MSFSVITANTCRYLLNTTTFCALNTVFVEKVKYRKPERVFLPVKRNYRYTGCHRRNGPNFGRVFLMLNYTDITQNTYIQS